VTFGFRTDARWLQRTSFTAFYFAQAVPIGLLTIALLAWLVARGSSLGEFVSYQGVVMLPWGFRLIAGQLKDRLAFPAMGCKPRWA